MDKMTRIMVVDGSEVARTVVARILRTEMAGARITTCGTGGEARSYLERHELDLVTTALMLPDMDGLDLCRAIRRSERHYNTPVIVVSGDADSRLLREGFAAGVTDYFDKSLGYRAFVEFIKDFTRRNQGMVGRVLYVEDSKTAAMLTQQMMEKHGLEVAQTATAERALEILMNDKDTDAERQIDLVVTDFFLKGSLTGGDLLHAIRAKLHYSPQELPVLVITGNDNEAKQAEVFHAGANDYVTKPIVEEVLLARIRSQLLIKQQFEALRRQAEELQRLATTDSLTGVRNKRYLLDHGKQLVTDRESQPVCAMLIDIDHFKLINDGLGHITGDHVLEALGELLNRSLPDQALPVRFGGEEFAVVLPRCPCEDGYDLAETLRQSAEALRPVGVELTISIGVACTEEHPGVNLTRLLALADQALYAAKAQGRNRVCAMAPEGAACRPPARRRDAFFRA
ncbi:MAG: diguanylate cyclase [Gammaproteobacteria bacterium]|nr:diguanylate cyclase [Gammaproteobacteria bacterium]